MPFPYSLPFPGASAESSGLTQITNHADALVSRLIEQYRDKPNVVALVRVQGDRFQAVEDTAWQLFTERWLASAVGEQLDVVGRLVGQPRYDADDDIYRLFVQARILINRSSGTAEDLIQLLRLVTPSGTTVQVKEMPPAGFRIELSGAVLTAEDLLIFLRSARGAAIYGELLWSEVADAETFCFETGPGLGFGSISDPSVGGKLAGIGV